MEKRKITICIHTYKRPEILADTLEHLAAVKSIDMEVVVSDNNSRDSTSQVVKAFEGRFPALRYHCQKENLGGIENRQTALSLASGEYAYTLCDDDRIIPEGIGAAIDLLDKQQDVVAVFGGYQEWNPKTDKRLQDIKFINETKIFQPMEREQVFNQFNLLWLPVLRTQIFQRFCFYDSYANGYWRLVSQLMNHGSIAVIPDLFYKHVQTEPRAEYHLTEPMFHDRHRADFELFIADMDLNYSKADQVAQVTQFINSRSIPTYLQGYRFATIKREFLTQRHYLLRAKAYALVSREQVAGWEQQFILFAVAEKIKNIIRTLPVVDTIFFEKGELSAYFRKIFPELGDDLPECVEIDQESLIRRDYDPTEILVAEKFETLAQRSEFHDYVDPVRQWALYDLINSLRLTKGHLNLTLPES